MFQQAGGGAGNVGVSAFAPKLHPLANEVDGPVFLNAIGGPIGKGLLVVLALLLGLGDRDEVRTGSTALDDFVGDPVIVELEVTPRLIEWGIDDRICDDRIFWHAPLPCPPADRDQDSGIVRNLNGKSDGLPVFALDTTLPPCKCRSAQHFRGSLRLRAPASQTASPEPGRLRECGFEQYRRRCRARMGVESSRAQGSASVAAVWGRIARPGAQASVRC